MYRNRACVSRLCDKVSVWLSCAIITCTRVVTIRMVALSHKSVATRTLSLCLHAHVEVVCMCMIGHVHMVTHDTGYTTHSAIISLWPHISSDHVALVTHFQRPCRFATHFQRPCRFATHTSGDLVALPYMFSDLIASPEFTNSSPRILESHLPTVHYM